MAGFDLLKFITGFLGGFDIPDIDAKITTWLAQEGVKYPDLKDRADALSGWLSGVLAETALALDPKAMAETVKTIARSIVNGTAGVDPDAWMFG